jgi:RNA polymerase sigma-70 factor (ECF subfamily)
VFQLPETRDSLLLQVRDPANRIAWEEFVELYRPVVYRVATARGLQDADALDLVQTVFVAIAGSLDRWEKLSPSTRFRHWLLRVAKNATINAITRRPFDSPLNTQAHTNTSDSLLECYPQPDREAESICDLEYRRELYLRAAEQVRVDVQPDTWKAFELTTIGGFSNESAARELGKSLGTIYASRSRIMKRLSMLVSEWDVQYREN